MVCGDGFDPGQNGIVKGGERQKNKIKNKNKIKREMRGETKRRKIYYTLARDDSKVQ